MALTPRTTARFPAGALRPNGASQAGLDAEAATRLAQDNLRQLKSEKGLANGYASLNSGGKVPLSQMDGSIVSGEFYQGTWNANTNSPAIVSSVGTQGYFYKVSVAGSTSINGISSWAVGDTIIFNGSVWQKLALSDVITALLAGTSPTLNTLTLTGGQIAFPATANPSSDPNTLDDYEEMAWTPLLNDEAGAVTGNVYATQIGEAIKVAKLVRYSMRISLSTKGTGYTGGMALRIDGFPYANNSGSFAANPCETDIIAYAGGRTAACLEPLSGATYAHLAVSGSAVGHANVTGADLVNGSAIYAGGTYSN